MPDEPEPEPTALPARELKPLSGTGVDLAGADANPPAREVKPLPSEGGTPTSAREVKPLPA